MQIFIQICVFAIIIQQKKRIIHKSYDKIYYANADHVIL